MAPIHAARPLDPRTLSSAARDRLAHALYAVQSQIFAGVSFDAFRAYVVDSAAQRNRIQVFSDAVTGDVVGFAATHVFTVELEDRTVDLLRSEVGLLPAYRGQTAAGALLLAEGARLAVRSVVREAYFLACPVHPASYWAVSRSCGQVWPRPEAPTPVPVQRMMDQLDRAIGLCRPAQAASPGVRKVGWITRQSAEEAAYWAGHSSEQVQFYLAQNPGYVRGHGLMVVAPVSVASVFDAGASVVLRKLRRLFRPRPAIATLRSPQRTA